MPLIVGVDSSFQKLGVQVEMLTKALRVANALPTSRIHVWLRGGSSIIKGAPKQYIAVPKLHRELVRLENKTEGAGH